MRVYGFKENMFGLMEVENSLEAVQKFVGGYIETIGMGNGIVLVCNEEGKLNNMAPVAVWVENNEIADVICGSCFLCRHDNVGNFISINEEDADYIKTKLLPYNEILKRIVFID